MSQDTTLHLDLAIPLPEGDSIQVLPGVSFWKRKRYRLSYRGWAVGIVGMWVVVANIWMQNDRIQHPWVQIFTDASKKRDVTGYAFLASRRDFVIGEDGGALGNTSVFQAEVVAIQAALLWLILNPHKLKGKKVKLLSD